MDTYTMIGLGVLAAALLFFFLYKPGGQTIAAFAPSRLTVRPGRALIDHFDEAGKDAAGREIEALLGKQKAAEIGKAFVSAFGSMSEPASPKV